jgi:hypothetical protein
VLERATSNFEKPIATLRHPNGPRSRQTSTSCLTADVQDLIVEFAAELPDFEPFGRLTCEVLEYLECSDRINSLSWCGTAFDALAQDTGVDDATGAGDELGVGLKKDSRRYSRLSKIARE